MLKVQEVRVPPIASPAILCPLLHCLLFLQREQEELAGPKGTPVTVERFLAWRKRFEIEMRDLRRKAADEELRALPPKERREREQFRARPNGREIFERKRGIADDEDEDQDEGDDGYVDITKYDREADRAQSDDEGEKGFLHEDSD